jgi:hypothetical protein
MIFSSGNLLRRISPVSSLEGLYLTMRAFQAARSLRMWQLGRLKINSD